MRLKSYAKVNLFLKIIGNRPNGYHELESLFSFVDLFDEIEINPNPEFNFTIDGPFAKDLNVDDNLITKILNYFAFEFGISKNLKIKLTKNIPLGAGLGGGSSNAAYFMKAINEIFSLNLAKSDLQRISKKFGSDIAFFLENQASIVRGCGEIIENYQNKFSPLPILLIYPNRHVSTKEVFEKFDAQFSQKMLNGYLQELEAVSAIKDLPNDLTLFASLMAPEIKMILQEFKNENAVAYKMTGSGSTCFAVFENEQELNNAYNNLSNKFSRFFIKKTHLLFHV